VVDFIQTVFDGLLFGTTYSLIGIGFTLIFGVMHKINMSYAAASIAGAYCGVTIPMLVPGMPPFVVFLGAIVAAAAIGLAVWLTCFRFIPNIHPLATLMSTVGMLLLIDEIVVHATAGMPVVYPPVYAGDPIEIGPFVLRSDLIAVFLVCVVAMVVLLFLLYRTRLGMATRALAQQPVAAQLCGIRVNHVNALTFVISGALGGVAGAMIGSAVEMLSPLIAPPLTVKGLIVTVIGGLGSIPGAIIAGLLVGVAENVFQWLRGVTERDLYVMLLLFVFLVLRPGGLFAAAGERR
jgi:branched-chain amino acid transport system permease protein